MLLVVNPYVKPAVVAAVQSSISAFALSDKIAGSPIDNTSKLAPVIKRVFALTQSVEPYTLDPKLLLSSELAASVTQPIPAWLMNSLPSVSDTVGTFWDINNNTFWTDDVSLGLFYYSSRNDTLLVDSLTTAQLVSSDHFSQIPQVLLTSLLGANQNASLAALNSWYVNTSVSADAYILSKQDFAETATYIKDIPSIWQTLFNLYISVTPSGGYVSTSDNNSGLDSAVAKSVIYTLNHPSDTLANSVSFHMDGEIGGVTPTDQLGSVINFTTSTQGLGLPRNSTATYVQGTHSIFSPSNSMIFVPAQNNILNFGTGDFTVECWFTQGGGSNLYNQMMFQYGDSGNTFAVYGGGGPYFSAGCNRIGVGNNGIGSGANYADINSWTHYAIVRSGNRIYWYVAGVNRTSGGYFSDSTNWNTTTGLYIGANSTGYYQRYHDGFRITKAARYTANFTPTAY